MGFRASNPAQNTTTTKTQVTNVALQTDSCDTLYITKNTLTAYTIAIIQNAQVLQYDQMHVALQTARNQASLETPLRAEELMTAHFNLAVLSNEANINKTLDAQKPEATNLDITIYLNHRRGGPTLRYPVGIMLQIAIQRSNTLPEPSPQPVEENMDLFNGIPAGYETDDSWDHDSFTHEHEHMHTHTHNIVPLLALCTWSNRLHRGREQLHRQNNNINVRSGNAPYPRPWDNQPYGRRTRSQQALRARAY